MTEVRHRLSSNETMKNDSGHGKNLKAEVVEM
jgi:hypothetical protein